MAEPVSPRIQALADRIAADIERLEGDVLPSSRELAPRYHVKRASLLKALQVLRDRGLLRFRPGQPVKIVGRAPAANPLARRRRTAAQRLSDELSAKIEAGELRHGEPLPKVNYYVLELRVSNRTVLAAYKMLADKELVHRSGKSWRAGPRPDPARNVSVVSPPVILIVQPKENSWRALHRSERTARFCEGILQEAQRRGIQVMSVLTSAHVSAEGVLPGGQDAVRVLIGELGSRYRGALIAADSREVPDLADWAFFLQSYGRPVAWFDRIGEEHVEKAPGRLFARCYFSERRAVACALRHLLDMGHTSIAYAIEYEGWTRTRFALLEEEADRLRSGVHLTSFAPDPSWYVGADREGCRGAIVEGYRNGTDAFRSAVEAFRLRLGLSARKSVDEVADAISRDAIGRFTPILTPYLERGGITALVASQDYHARQFFYWFTTVGATIPGDLSLLSFDNYLELSPLPVSSVDFGFGHLGYAAFHFIMQDIPVSRDREGNIPARPFVVNRGSVARVGLAP